MRQLLQMNTRALSLMQRNDNMHAAEVLLQILEHLKDGLDRSSEGAEEIGDPHFDLVNVSIGGCSVSPVTDTAVDPSATYFDRGFALQQTRPSLSPSSEGSLTGPGALAAVFLFNAGVALQRAAIGLSCARYRGKALLLYDHALKAIRQEEASGKIPQRSPLWFVAVTACLNIAVIRAGQMMWDEMEKSLTSASDVFLRCDPSTISPHDQKLFILNQWLCRKRRQFPAPAA